jgi:hypothetical protein
MQSEASKSLINKAHKLQLGIKKIQLYFLYSRKMISKRSEISFAHGGGIPPPHYSMLSTTPFLRIQEGREARKPCRPFPSSTGPASASPCSRCGLLFAPLVVSRGLSSGCLPGAPWAPPRPGCPTSPPPLPPAGQGSPMIPRRLRPAWPKKTTVGAASYSWFLLDAVGVGGSCGFSGFDWFGGGEIGALVLDRLPEKMQFYLQLSSGLHLIGLLYII